MKITAAVIEVDSGVFRPKGYGVSCTDKDREAWAVNQVSEIMALLSSSLGGLSASAGKAVNPPAGCRFQTGRWLGQFPFFRSEPRAVERFSFSVPSRGL